MTIQNGYETAKQWQSSDQMDQWDNQKWGLVIFSVKIHVKLSHDSLFAVKIFIDFSEN